MATAQQVDLQELMHVEEKEVTVAEIVVTVESAEVVIVVVVAKEAVPVVAVRVVAQAVQAEAAQVVQEHVSNQIFVEYFNKKL